jgi:hypothetical protein
LKVADDKLYKYARYADLVKGNTNDAEVRFMSFFLRKNTRKMDKRYYIVTYNELSRILGNFNITLENPSGNYIDVVKHEKKTGFLGRTRQVQTRLCRLGFPGWTKQVSEKDIKTIRKEARLTPSEGVDSQTFFKGVETLGALIAEYEPALRRLAER